MPVYKPLNEPQKFNNIVAKLFVRSRTAKEINSSYWRK